MLTLQVVQGRERKREKMRIEPLTAASATKHSTQVDESSQMSLAYFDPVFIGLLFSAADPLIEKFSSPFFFARKSFPEKKVTIANIGVSWGSPIRKGDDHLSFDHQREFSLQ